MTTASLLDLQASTLETGQEATVSHSTLTPPRLVSLDSNNVISWQRPPQRRMELYPADFTDNTQYYDRYDSNDERLSLMERREPLADDQCVPMQEWQTTYHPHCNGVHELGLEHFGSLTGDDFRIFGTKGYWRNAWRVDSNTGDALASRDTMVLKTLK